MKKLLSIAVLAALGSAAQASISVNIDTDGGALAQSAISVGALDWTVGNALSVARPGDSVAAGGAQVGDRFTTYVHAKLASFNDINGDPIFSLNSGSAFEWTFVAGFQEQFTTVTGPGGAGTSAFKVLNTAADVNTNFFKIYYDTAKNGVALSGKGFADGTEILSGHFISGEGAFTVAGTANNPAMGALDQFGTDNYGGKQTLIGNGSTSVKVAVDTYDSAFFDISILNGLNIDFTSQQKLAFNQTNPSACFWTGTGYMGGAGSAIEGCADTIGAINGISGPNLILQADASSSFDARVPEPGSLALLGLGFAAFGAMRRKVVA